MLLHCAYTAHTLRILFSILHTHRMYTHPSTCLGSCWCFVCEVPVAKCVRWNSKDAKLPAHCNAHTNNRFWASIKAAAVHSLRCAEATIIDG